MSGWNHESDPRFNQLDHRDHPGWHRGVEQAHWVDRVWAAGIDNIWLIPLCIWRGSWPEPIGTTYGAAVAAYWVFNTYMTARTGQSLGKRLLGIRLYRVLYDPRTRTGHYVVPGWPAWFRWLLHYLDLIPGLLGYLWPLWDDKRQTFADKAAGTFCAAKADQIQLTRTRPGMTRAE